MVTSTVSGWAERHKGGDARKSKKVASGGGGGPGGGAVLATDVFVRPQGSDRFCLVAHITSLCPASEESAAAGGGGGAGAPLARLEML